MSRNDTNLLLKDLAEMMEMDNQQLCHITVLVGGQIITGTLISEDEYFSLEDNIGLKDYFNENIKARRKEIIEGLDKGESIDFPDELKEYFLYLKKAYYIHGLTRFPETVNGISIQVRVSDISALTYRGFNADVKEVT